MNLIGDMEEEGPMDPRDTWTSDDDFDELSDEPIDSEEDEEE